ncbi:MAG: Stp1/IreP family PP2C-type Ser/Thr phosphatase [Bryobacterales bacterium]
MIRSYGMSHVGRVRTNNEDSYVARPELHLFAVADGMGGAQAGERASQVAIQTVVEEVERSGGQADIEDLAAAVREANRRVRTQARHAPELAGMGTTVVAAIVHSDRIQIVNVGDSRAYLLSDGALYCITTDHSWINEVGRGLGLSDEQLRTHPYRNVLTKAVGAEDQVEVQKLEIEFRPGDLLLLCSDGLHGVAGDRTIQEVLRQGGGLRERCESLIRATLERGAPDNITAVLVERADNGDA